MQGENVITLKHSTAASRAGSEVRHWHPPHSAAATAAGRCGAAHSSAPGMPARNGSSAGKDTAYDP